jgi:hypothetical protein
MTGGLVEGSLPLSTGTGVRQLQLGPVMHAELATSYIGLSVSLVTGGCTTETTLPCREYKGYACLLPHTPELEMIRRCSTLNVKQCIVAINTSRSQASEAE